MNGRIAKVNELLPQLTRDLLHLLVAADLNDGVLRILADLRDNRLGLLLKGLQPFPDRLLVIISPSACLASFQQPLLHLLHRTVQIQISIYFQISSNHLLPLFDVLFVPRKPVEQHNILFVITHLHPFQLVQNHPDQSFAGNQLPFQCVPPNLLS